MIHHLNNHSEFTVHFVALYSSIANYDSLLIMFLFFFSINFEFNIHVLCVLSHQIHALLPKQYR